MKKLLSIVALIVSINSSAIVMVSHTGSSHSRHNNGDIQCLNDTTFMYHYHLDSDVDNDTIIYARTADECLSIAKDYDNRHDNTLVYLICIVIFIIAGWYGLHRLCKF